MARFKVLITDYAWPDLNVERKILAAAEIEIVEAPAQDEATLIELARDVDAIMTCWANVPASVIAAAPKCQLVSRLGIGLDNIDVAYCTEHKIPVTNVPTYCSYEVAEHALALVFACARNIAWFHWQTKRGVYELTTAPVMRRMTSQTLGIIGFGSTGEKLASKAAGVGLRVLAHSRSEKSPRSDVTFCDLDTLLRESDFVSLHLPLTDETRHLISDAELAKMKPSAYLINTARGGVIDQAALTRALAENRIAGAGLDVQDPEPPDLSEPLFQDPRVIVTPHSAFTSLESLDELRNDAAEQVAARLHGRRPENVVNPEVF